MPLNNIDVLVSEVKRQTAVALTSPAHSSSGPDRNSGMLILIENQDSNHYLDLNDWCTNLCRIDETGWENVVIPEKCQVYLWKFLAFTNSTLPIIDSGYQQERCRDIQNIQLRYYDINGSRTEDIWQSAGLRSWVQSADSSVAIVQGNSQTMRCLETFSYEISLQLLKISPTIWMLSEPSSRDFLATNDEDELLRQLAIQALKQIPNFKADFFIEVLCLFKQCKSSHGWFQILKMIFRVLPKVYTILNVDVLGARSSCAKNWPDEFQLLISQMGIECSSKLSVMLLSSRQLPYKDKDTLVISATSQSQRIHPMSRKRPLGEALPLIRCRSRIMSTDGVVYVEHNPKAAPEVRVASDDLIVEIPTRSEGIRPLRALASSCDSPQDCSEASKGILDKMHRVSGKDSVPHRNDIAIAIICALPLEAEAVLTIFDHLWNIQCLGNLGRDKNAYSVGAIGCHNVVLVHMSGMGRVPAATAAASCRASFPNIRLALIVGVCGVISFRNRSTEILLGDVVISDRLVIYDFGKQFPDKFMRKDGTHDNARKPPEEVKNFLSKMKVPTHHGRLQARTGSILETLKGHGIESYPGLEEDRLFKPHYRHQHQKPLECHKCVSTEDFNGQICEEARTSTCDDLGCDSTRLVVRQRHFQAMSDAKSWLPVIHFGAYASVDTVMKSGEHRDRIAEREEVIAFEMEGAGVWEIFPCIIIKGACDYADSHKNKKWQSYAAITAAACLKAFLEDWLSGKLEY
ncbi:nucleoside phosphorylase domain-containing protein [Xylaria arbuscula]|nr:nucleoside phosphorylase domain-containing protein [Xylaria arbuscula]